MRLLRCLLFSAFLLLAATGVIAAELASVSGLNSLPAVAWSELSHRDLTPLGSKALSIRADDWKHAETAHFIYHYRQSHVATPISVEAEFHYRVIMKELGREEAAGGEKAHIYIFEKPANWEIFQLAGHLEPWTGGIQSGNSLFILRDPAYRFSDNSLGHEIVHLLVRRFYGTQVPLWLNEGFAQYASKNAHASFQRARGYLAKARSNGVPREKLFGLRTLTTMSYPPADQVEAFYDQSERLVRFLIAADRARFLELFVPESGALAFDDALEAKFVAYATNDAGSSPAD